MDANSLYQEIVAFCRSNSDEKIVVKYSKFFKEGYDAYGLSTAVFEDKIAVLKLSQTIDLALLLEAAPLFLKSGKYEETSFLLVLTESLKESFDSQTFDAIGKWYEYGIINWAHADNLCGSILPYFFSQRIIPLWRLNDWRISTKKFQRRSVPVTLIKLLKSTEDLTPFFGLIDPLMMDNERVVHQGLGWFLREAWKLRPEETEVFLLKWKDNSARLIFQYATERMDKDNRLKFRKTRD